MSTPSPPAVALSRKLGVKEGHSVVLVHAPKLWALDDLPPGARVVQTDVPVGPDVVVAFFSVLARLQEEVPALAEAVYPASALWLAWPRRAAGHHSDITDNDVRSAALTVGLVDVKVAALGEDWSGLRFLWRKDLRQSRQRSGWDLNPR